MNRDTRTVTEVVRQLDHDGEAKVAVVLCSDGKLGVLQNGKLLPDAQWTVDRMSECVEFAERLRQR